MRMEGEDQDKFGQHQLHREITLRYLRVYNKPTI